VACIDFEPGKKCKRCERLGLVCEPAAQKPRTEMMSVAQKFSEDRAGPPTHPSPVASLALAVEPQGVAGLIWQAADDVGSSDVARFTLRHFASIAIRRNAYMLLTSVVSICKTKHFDLGSILHAPDDDDDASPHPYEILRTVSSAPGYCLARSVNASGRSAYFTNAAFEHDIMSISACNRAYDRNELDVLSCFIHADDCTDVHALLATVFRAAACNSGQMESLALGRTARIFHCRLKDYISCHVHISMLIRCDTGCVSVTVELTPRNSDTPRDSDREDQCIASHAITDGGEVRNGGDRLLPAPPIVNPFGEALSSSSDPIHSPTIGELLDDLGDELLGDALLGDVFAS